MYMRVCICEYIQKPCIFLNEENKRLCRSIKYIDHYTNWDFLIDASLRCTPVCKTWWRSVFFYQVQYKRPIWVSHTNSSGIIVFQAMCFRIIYYCPISAFSLIVVRGVYQWFGQVVHVFDLHSYLFNLRNLLINASFLVFFTLNLTVPPLHTMYPWVSEQLESFGLHRVCDSSSRPFSKNVVNGTPVSPAWYQISAVCVRFHLVGFWIDFLQGTISLINVL